MKKILTVSYFFMFALFTVPPDKIVLFHFRLWENLPQYRISPTVLPKTDTFMFDKLEGKRLSFFKMP